jgi:hypothetical protein
MINLKLLAAAAAGSAFLALTPSIAFAADNHFPPTIGAPNCHGNVIGYGASHGHPPGQVARTKGVPVKTIQQSVKSRCSGA